MTSQSSIDIVIVTYNRRNLLEKTINGIIERTRTPYRIIVVDNHSTADDTVEYLKRMKDEGKIHVLLLNDENKGLAPGYTQAFNYVESEYFITTNDDLIPPDLEPGDWVTQLKDLFDKFYPEYGAVSLRCARMKNVYFNDPGRIEWLPHDEIGEAVRSAPALFRMQKRSDVEKVPSRFGTQGGYNDEYQCKRLFNMLNMRAGFARDLWCNHIGFALDNRGYPKDFTKYAGHSLGRELKNKKLGYPEVDPKTNIPLNYIKK